MAVVSDTAIARAAEAAGFPRSAIATAVAVALAESGGNATATNTNSNGSTDYGLWQINSIHRADIAGGNWQDPGDNARMAYAVWSRAGRQWTPWMAYDSGKHLAYMARGTAAAAGSGNQDNANVVEAGNPLSGANDLMKQASKVIEVISDKDLWIRIGMFAAGALLLIVAIVGISWTLNGKKALQIVTGALGGTTKAVTRTAGKAAAAAAGNGE